ncbi:hypothetical protein [Myroides sp. WP-1]|uniref:hypothetical protein n=1 Tax=Myroides sp. WP-1 TaxID=2759944 RepID=UPI0015F978AD|nr:hypothetical protein [Myroides sp. WP-1]MBB1138720.1 hypothetical protein [Myroides sp. WP-1]
MKKLYYFIPILLFLSCSKDDTSVEQKKGEPGVYKQSTAYCYLEDELGNCYDGGPPIILPEILIGVPGAGGGTGIGDLWLEMLPSMSTLFNANEGSSSNGSDLSNGDQVDQNSPQYLNVQKILNDSLIVATLQEIFIEVTQSASEVNGRREAGAYIFYDEVTDKFYVGNVKYGEYVQGGAGTNGSVSLGSGSVSSNSDENNVIPLTAIPIAAFHTHTPLTYVIDEASRKIGLSPADIAFADRHNIPMIVLDYVGMEGTDGNFYIQNGHPIDDPSNFIIYYPQKN